MGKLVRLEVDNFKSYKGHQVIGPFHKFTSVIGPNGSGKSNLMDAISFVLGVNSQHLRSQSLKDMIYRPTAMQTDSRAMAARRAHVVLVYENARGQEVRFKRTVQHSGQSEYRINDRQVTFAEYNTALQKENILIKAKNFLVFQGDVESVASQSAKDLTKLIEQISGSWEYKEEYDRLKKIQDRAIEDSAHAFNKKRGVTSEVKQYKEQKQEAEKFESLVRERRQVAVQYLLWKLYHIEQRSQELEKSASNRKMDADGATGDQVQLEEQFKATRKEQALIHREKTRRELQIKKLKKELEEHRPNLISIQEQVSHIEKRLEQTKHNGDRLKHEHDQQAQEVANLEQSLTKLNKSSEEYEASLPESGLVKGPVLTAEQVEQYEQLKQQVSMRAVTEEQQLEQLQRQHKMELENVKRITSKTEEFQVRKSQLLEDERQLVMDGQALVDEAEGLDKQLKSRKKDLVALEEERKTTHQREIQLNEQLQETLNRLMQAKAEQRESEKETRFKECLNMMKQIFPGVHGKLVDLCRPTQRRYDVAVATVLGRNMDSIVVEDQRTAIECIQYMRDQRVGTATFLPLNSIQVPMINDRFRNYTRGARLAVDVVKSDKKFETVLQYACGSTIVCDTVQIAKQICYEKNEDVKAVTLDGTVIHRSGLITGGHSTNQAATRWQESDIEGLTRTRDKLLGELNDLNKQRRMGSAEEAAKNDCAELEGQLSVLREEITTAEQKLQDVRNEMRYIEEQLVSAQAPYDQAKEKLDSLASSIEQMKSAFATIEDEIFADFCSRIGVSNIREYESMRYGIPEEVIEQRAQFAAQRSRLETQLSFERGQLSELAERLSKLETMYNEDTKTLADLQTQISQATERMRQMNEDLATSNAELQEQTALEDEKQEAVDQLRAKLEAKGRDVQSYLKEMAQVETEMEKVHAERVAIFRKCKLEDIELPLLRGSMDDVIMEDNLGSGSLGTSTQSSSAMDVDDEPPSQLSIRSTDWMVEVNYDSLDEDLKENGSSARDEEFKDELKRRAEEIDEMAPNMKAIDRLEGVEQRLKEAEDQFDDARRDAKRAKQEFSNVKQKRYKLFYDAYSHISGRIDRVYKALTTSETFPHGGTAYLSLDDSEEPYLEGIRYHAMPPMKKFRDMDQLSGGEKSIAALALLFAIHSYQPSPFFVLDEVDAALDNTNVVTVASYIREHASDDFQFIVISLKNTLYEKAESLVGIYRDQDANSSKTLSLMLEPYQE